jgi:hypothetical protein
MSVDDVLLDVAGQSVAKDRNVNTVRMSTCRIMCVVKVRRLVGQDGNQNGPA